MSPNRYSSSITATAGDSMIITFTAMDGTGNIITDWNTTGDTIIVMLNTSWANRDTSSRSWNADPDGYTFARFGAPAIPSWENAWSIPPSAFSSGIAQLTFEHAGAQSGVHLSILDMEDTLTQRSPLMTFQAGPAANVLLDITSQTAGGDGVYRLRNHELVVMPRDRHMNVLSSGQVRLRFTPRFPFEYDSLKPGLSDIFRGDVFVIGPTFFTLSSLQAHVAGAGPLQSISVRGVTNPSITGATDAYEILDHAPAAPVLKSPPSHHDYHFYSYNDTVAFSWTRPNPPDPFTNIKVSSTSGTRYSDTVQYTVVFCDSATLTPRARRDVEWRGASYRSLTAEEASEIIDLVAGSSADTAHIVWYVEATDGIYSSVSTPPYQDPSGQPGFFCHLKRPTISPTPWVDIAPNTLARPIDRPAGDTVTFTLTARSTNNSIITDWNTTGGAVTLLLKNSTANVDTLLHSWNADTAGYSWARFEAPAAQVAVNAWSVPASAFVNGVARVTFTQSRAENGVYVQIDPATVPQRQRSARMNFSAGAATNFALELTQQTASPSEVFLKRPYELVAIPRDRYLNTVAGPIATQFTARYPAEFDSSRYAVADIFSGPVAIAGATPFILASSIERTDQMISAQAAGNAAIAGVSDPYAVRTHAPAAFALQSPPSHSVYPYWGQDSIDFFWQRPAPPDPFTDIQLSRYNPAMVSDTLIYTVVFTDSATLTRSVRLPADGQGTIAKLHLSRAQAHEFVEIITGDSLANVADVIWYVEATDGDSTRISFPPLNDAGGQPGFYVHIEKPPMVHGRMQLQAPWTGPALDTGAGVTVHLTLDVKDLQGMAIPDWNLHGYPVDISINSTANSDTSTRSWSGNPDAYTFVRLMLVGTSAKLTATGPHSWSIPPEAFAQGRAEIALADSKAERDVTITVSHAGLHDSWQASSAPMHFAAGKAANLFVDITSQVSGASRVYYRRPYELLLAARDAYMNPTEDSLVLSCVASRPAEFDSGAAQGGGLFIPGDVGIRGMGRFLLVSTDTTVKPNGLQQIHAQAKGDATIAGSSNRYEILTHAPYAATPTSPPSHAVIDVPQSPVTVAATFNWSSQIPSDPFSGIRISRFDPALASDDVRCTVLFEDSATHARQVRVPSYNNGAGNRLELSAQELRGIGDAIMQRTDWTSCPVSWYVETSDGIFTTRSNGAGSWYVSLNAITTSVDDVRPSAAAATLAQNFPNPVSAAAASGGATTIAFSLQNAGSVTLKVYSLVGAELATLADGDYAPGEHRIRFNTDRFPAGVYMYTLRAGGIVLSRTLTLMR